MLIAKNRNTIDFYILVLHSSTLLNLYVSKSSGFSINYKIMSLTKTVLFLPFQSRYFVFFSCLIALARTCESGYLCLVPDLREIASCLLPFSVMFVSYWVFVDALYQIEKIHFYFFFIMKEHKILSNFYYAPVEIAMWFYFLVYPYSILY